MLIINKINYRTKRYIKIDTYILLIFSKSFIIGNIAIFEDFNIGYMSIKKTNL